MPSPVSCYAWAHPSPRSRNCSVTLTSVPPRSIPRSTSRNCEKSRTTMVRTTEMEKRPELAYQSFLAEAIRDYLDYLDHLGFRVVGLAYALGRIDRFLVDHQVESFDQHDPLWVMTRLVDQYQGRFKGQTLQAWRQAFQGLCRYLVRQGWMKENPLADFPSPRPQPYRPYVFSPGELRRFFDYLQQRIARAPHARALYRAHGHY